MKTDDATDAAAAMVADGAPPAVVREPETAEQKDARRARLKITTGPERKLKAPAECKPDPKAAGLKAVKAAKSKGRVAKMLAKKSGEAAKMPTSGKAALKVIAGGKAKVAATKPAKAKAAKAPKAAKAVKPAADAKREPTQVERCAELLCSPKGITIDQLCSEMKVKAHPMGTLIHYAKHRLGYKVTYDREAKRYFGSRPAKAG